MEKKNEKMESRFCYCVDDFGRVVWVLLGIVGCDVTYLDIRKYRTV